MTDKDLVLDLSRQISNSIPELRYLPPKRIETITAQIAKKLTPLDDKDPFSLMPYEVIELFVDAYKKAIWAKEHYPQETALIPPLTKFAEESGEVIKASTKCAENRGTMLDVYNELVDALAMMIRLYIEGDQKHKLLPISTIKKRNNEPKVPNLKLPENS